MRGLRFSQRVCWRFQVFWDVTLCQLRTACRCFERTQHLEALLSTSRVTEPAGTRRTALQSGHDVNVVRTFQVYFKITFEVVWSSGPWYCFVGQQFPYYCHYCPDPVDRDIALLASSSLIIATQLSWSSPPWYSFVGQQFPYYCHSTVLIQSTLILLCWPAVPLLLSLNHGRSYHIATIRKAHGPTNPTLQIFTFYADWTLLTIRANSSVLARNGFRDNKLQCCQQQHNNGICHGWLESRDLIS